MISFALIDIDLRSANNPNIPSIVPIPSRSFDYINKYGKTGPTNLFGQYGIAEHRYFGIIYANCKGCNDLETYWIYSKHNTSSGAFYARRVSSDTYDIDLSELLKNTDDYIKKLVPEDRRIYIRN